MNGSDHGLVASYLELYEEGEVEHINGVWPVLSVKQPFAVRSILRIKTKPTIEPPTLAF